MDVDTAIKTALPIEISVTPFLLFIQPLFFCTGKKPVMSSFMRMASARVDSAKQREQHTGGNRGADDSRHVGAYRMHK